MSQLVLVGGLLFVLGLSALCSGSSVCARASMHACVCVGMYVCTYICMYIHMYVRTYVCIYNYTCIMIVIFFTGVTIFILMC